MTFFELPAYLGDHRGGTIQSASLRMVGELPSNYFIDLCGPVEAVNQIIHCFPGQAVMTEIPAELKASVSHSLYVEKGITQAIRDLGHLLQEVVSIPCPESVDCAVAMDWYKVVDEDVDPAHWDETPMGQCIQYTKHATNPTWSNSRRKWLELVAALAGFINRHPDYAAAQSVGAAPGSKADGDSFGERLARAVAARTGKPFIPATAAGPRSEQKLGLHQDLSSAFTMSAPVRGTIIMVDDVYRTGATMSGAAKAARRAGATRVLALTAARTMRM